MGYPRLSKTQLVIGLCQLGTMWIIIGYIWSIGWAIMILLKKKDEMKEPLNKQSANPFDKSNVGRPIPSANAGGSGVKI